MAVRKLTSTLIHRPLGIAIELPPPSLTGGKSIEECLRLRRSCRMFADDPVTLEQASQLLWAGQGFTGLGGLRTAPSAGAVYPFHVYLVAMNVTGLSAGAYAYDPDRHILSLRKPGALRPKLQKAVCDQDEVENAAMGLLLAARYERSKREFGEKGPMLADIEAGHIGANVMLQAVSLSLGVIGLSKIDAPVMRGAVDLPEAETPVYLLLAGPK
jgi:SagB-type dehydrogenase family enzyme